MLKIYWHVYWHAGPEINELYGKKTNGADCNLLKRHIPLDLKTGTITGSHALPQKRYTLRPYFGWGTILRYGLGDFQPRDFCCASSFETEGRMMTSSPCFQFTGVATLYSP